MPDGTETESIDSTHVVPRKYLMAFVLTTCCFALWGFANDVTNPLVKVFKEVFQISNTQSSLVQFAFYGGYFTMALPAAYFIRRFSYKGAIMVGFALYAIGALLSIPASLNTNFWIFIAGFYVLTFGLAFLETSCNPYILAMGPVETATQRLNLAQAFNPIGSLTGMVVASTIIAPNLDVAQFRGQLESKSPAVVKYVEAEYPDGLPNFDEEFGTLDAAVGRGLANMRANDPDAFLAIQQHDLGVVRTPYVVIGGVVIGFLILFARHQNADVCQRRAGRARGRVDASIDWQGALPRRCDRAGFLRRCPNHVLDIHHSLRDGAGRAHPGRSTDVEYRGHGDLLGQPIRVHVHAQVCQPRKTACHVSHRGDCPDLRCDHVGGKTGLTCLVLISACMSLMFPTIYGIAPEGLTRRGSQTGFGRFDHGDCRWRVAAADAGLVHRSNWRSQLVLSTTDLLCRDRRLRYSYLHAIRARTVG